MSPNLHLLASAGRRNIVNTKPLGEVSQLATHTIIYLLPNNQPGLRGINDAPSTPCHVSSTPISAFITTQDHKGHLMASLRNTVELVNVIQNKHDDRSLHACQQLLKLLNQLLDLVDGLYSNSTWFDRPPPNALHQTLRRLKNWGIAASQTSTFPVENEVSSKIEGFSSKLKQTATEMTHC
ncbi:hypothetical protein FRB95_008601 [Tulasnella sp. JGI-2019a]|nr:hypothetical protein FRB95_008601 [Tulasnella sp. JGI-2019a]